MRILLATGLMLVALAGLAWAGDRAEERRQMIESTIVARGLDDPAVLRAMQAVPRHRFVPEDVQDQAYEDGPLPIGHGQTISQPYVVALMTWLAGVAPGEKVLEVGTGSGYQAAVLAECGAEVYSIEILEPLARDAARILKELGYAIHLKVGDGYKGWPEHAPFDAIVVTAAPPKVPKALKEQLAVGGRLVVPEGRFYQTLKVYERTRKGYVVTSHGGVRFVPMVPGKD